MDGEAKQYRVDILWVMSAMHVLIFIIDYYHCRLNTSLLINFLVEKEFRRLTNHVTKRRIQKRFVSCSEVEKCLWIVSIYFECKQLSTSALRRSIEERLLSKKKVDRLNLFFGTILRTIFSSSQRVWTI